MSLVNQMLRDLNARHAGEVQATLHADVRPLPDRSERSALRRNFMPLLGGGALLLVALGLAVAGWNRLSATHENVTSPVQAAADVPQADPLAPGASVAPTAADSMTSVQASAPDAESHALASSGAREIHTRPTPVKEHVKEHVEKITIPATTSFALKPLEASTNGKSEKPRSSSGLRVDETLELASLRGSGRMNAVSTREPQEKPAGRETNRSPATSTTLLTSSSALPVLMADERIVLTRKDLSGQDDKPEKIERNERAATQAVIEKQDRSERGDDGYHDGVQAYQQGRLKDAVVQLQAVLRENPKHLQARQALLGIYMEYKRYDDAIILLQMGLDQMPGQASWAMTMARIQVERGNQAEALATLEKYQVAGERNADYQGFIAVLSQNLRRPHEAVLRYKAALRLKPREGRWWFALGEALEADKRASEAIEAYRQAQSIGGLTAAMNDVLLTKLRR